MPDPVPVELPASGLVVAMGNLLQESGQRAVAAELLRGDLRRIVTERLGLDGRLPPATMAEAVSARTGIPLEHLQTTMAGAVPHNDAELLALAQAVDATRLEILNAR